MNGLSWLLYLSNVAEAVGIASVLVLIGCAVASLGSGVAWIISDDPERWESDRKARAAAKGVMKVVIPVAIICLTISIFVPGKNTIMLIAASELGEDVLKTDAVQKAGGEAGEIAVDSLKLLRKYLDEQLGETKPE